MALVKHTHVESAQDIFSYDQRVDFIENKPIDYRVLEQNLADSQASNHWANFGPANAQLQQYLKDHLGLSDNKAVVMCKSGTAALHTLVSLEELKAGKKLNWVISSFGFIASNVGCLEDAQILDCDAAGMLHFDALANLPVDSWDGVVITNTFGLLTDISQYEALCSKHNKILIVDNAVGLYSSWRHAHSPNESISFHQTKPWGMGEGGCVIIDKQDTKLVEDMICFGRGRPAEQRRYFTNEKMADVNAALILSWMQQKAIWTQQFQQQAQRIAELAHRAGFELLQPLDPNNVYGNVAILAPHKLDQAKLDNSYLQLMKYYYPLAPTVTAKRIYSRIVNVPTHREVARISDQRLTDLFSSLVDISMSQVNR